MSDEMKHTPAPWRVQTFAALDGYEVVSDSWDVVSASLRPAAPIRKLSDARLIAAAPDMLEALRRIVHAIDGYGCLSEKSDYDLEARAAIAKATGGNDD